jgi:hypothetical protein
VLLIAVYSAAAWSDRPLEVAAIAGVTLIAHGLRNPWSDGLGDYLFAPAFCAAGFVLGRIVHARSSGRQAIEELRLMLGLLRGDGAPDEAVDRSPQPGLGRLPALIESIRRNGLTVELHEAGEPAALPAGEDVSACRGGAKEASACTPGCPARDEHPRRDRGGPGARPHTVAHDP